MSNPAVTVAMAAHNAAAHVSAAIDSILAQSFTDFEFLIINDGSTDNTLHILRSYAARDPRIRIVNQPNRGVIAVRNQSLELARAPFLCCIDHDDIAAPDRIAAQLHFLRRHPDVAVVGGWFHIIDHAGRPIRLMRLPSDHLALDELHLAGATAINHPTAMLRTDIARRVGGYDPHTPFAEDLDLWLRIAEFRLIANLPAPVLFYRDHLHSASSTSQQLQLASMRTACHNAWRRRGLPPRPIIDRHWRPAPDRRSRRDYTIQQGWLAFTHGHRRTALVYGAKSLRLDPTSIPAWKLLACAALQRSPSFA
ncbi:MAG TPA: glycosyltransferase family A protein [Phycisphaerae bacterium]|nr:glycosyltransferase family A protein [Phycisphaerae bacterium]